MLTASLNAQRTLAFLLIASVLWNCALKAQENRPKTALIDGIVVDTNLAPLADATVSMVGFRFRLATRSNGRFRIARLAAGRYLIIVRRLGYQPQASVVAIGDGDTLRPSFVLERAPLTLDTVVTIATERSTRIAEFEDRKRLGFGHFLTSQEIEKRNAITVADLIRTVLSVHIQESGYKQIAFDLRAGCPFQILLDGVPLPPPVSLTDLPPPRELAGIEIYSGPATVPLQYKGLHSGCGVIIVWMKAGS